MSAQATVSCETSSSSERCVSDGMRSVYHVKFRAPCSRENASSSMRPRKKSSTLGGAFTDRMRATHVPLELPIDSSTQRRPKSCHEKNEETALHATPSVAGIAQ